METHLDELVSHENITICVDFAHMDTNWITLQIHMKIYQQMSMAMNRKYKGGYMPEAIIVTNKAR